ncbi:[histone H3]-lysine(4) N-trimethyltransferase [Trifolium repens]|nr:[histone H3]-lysine(4) N-trimethyltransferase [Trifolium repens]
MIFLLELNWHMTIILNGSEVRKFVASVVHSNVLDSLVQSLVVFKYSIEKIPLYDSAEDELTSNVDGQSDQSMAIVLKAEELSDSTVLDIQPLNSSIEVKDLGRNYRIGPRSITLDSLYNEIRPAIEEHERDTQDSVSTTVAEKWIQACCLKLKAEFDLYSSIIINVGCNTQRAPNQAKSTEADNENKIKLLTAD